MIPTGLLPAILTRWVDVGPPGGRLDERNGDPPGDRPLPTGIAEELLSEDAARRTQAFAVTGGDFAWDLELASSGVNLAMTIVNTAGNHD